MKHLPGTTRPANGVAARLTARLSGIFSARLATRLALDAVMFLLFVISLDFRTTGRKAHEWAGMAFFLLLALHTCWNWRWYGSLFTGKYTPRRVVNTFINLALVAVMAALCLCGILNSRHIFGFSQLINGERTRQIHTVAAYWSLVLAGIHTGLHWEMIMGTARKRFGFTGRRKAAVFLARAFAVAIAGAGVWASYERGMGSKMFLGHSFDFWPADRPLALFYSCNMAVAGLYIFIAHYISKVLKIFSKPHGTSQGSV